MPAYILLAVVLLSRSIIIMRLCVLAAENRLLRMKAATNDTEFSDFKNNFIVDHKNKIYRNSRNGVREKERNGGAQIFKEHTLTVFNNLGVHKLLSHIRSPKQQHTTIANGIIFNISRLCSSSLAHKRTLNCRYEKH